MIAPDAASTEVAAGCVFAHDGRRLTRLEGHPIARHNFRDPAFLSQAALRQLNVLQERFVQSLASRLSAFLRLECNLKVATFTTTKFATFVETIATPTHLTLFQADPLRGIGLLEVRPALALAMTDRLLGGKGQASQPERVLTEIELALMDDALQLILEEWAQLWPGENALRVRVIEHESSARFLQTSPPQAPFLVLTLDVALGACAEQIQLGVPFSMIEPLLKKVQPARAKIDALKSNQLAWRASYNGIEVPVTAEWNVREMSVAEVLQLKFGDVLELPRELITQTRVRFSDTHEFIGTVGMQNGNVAVQLQTPVTL